MNEVLNFLNEKTKVLLIGRENQLEIEGKNICPLNQQEIASLVPCGKLKVNQIIRELVEEGYVEMVHAKVFVQDKAIFAEEDDSQEFRIFVNKIKNSVECFRKRLEVTKLEYEKLVEKKKERQISASEEDRFIYLYKVLSSYDYVDKMPDILVRNSTQDTLEDMLATLKELKQCLRKE